jgi:hypothetical protein
MLLSCSSRRLKVKSPWHIDTACGPNYVNHMVQYWRRDVSMSSHE